MSVTPPRPPGPPLNALRAFEAAARHGSFSAAADELCVTPGAVAQHIKSLEAWAGARLFERRAQGVAPTALAGDVLARFSSAFDMLGEAVQALRAGAAPDRVRIAALPSLAQLWLSPRMPAIRAAYPQADISVYALETPPNLKREPFDLSLFFEDAPGQSHAVALGRDVIFPVCAPELAGRLNSIADLPTVPCLHDAAWSGDWQAWLDHAAPGVNIAHAGPVYSLYSLALEEARNGAGVLIGHEVLVRAHLEAGTLVAPFAPRLELPRHITITSANPIPPGTTSAGIIDHLGH